jgi:hypothetical protein
MDLTRAGHGIIGFGTILADELTETLQLLKFQGFFLPPSKAIAPVSHNLLVYKLAPSNFP